MHNLNHIQKDTDIWTVYVDHLVSITPLSLDLTARTHFDHMENELSTSLVQLETLGRTIGNSNIPDEENPVKEHALQTL
jgi:hypothetical protein